MLHIYGIQRFRCVFKNTLIDLFKKNEIYVAKIIYNWRFNLGTSFRIINTLCEIR